MNKSIRFTALFSLLLTVALLVHLSIIHTFKEDDYAYNPLNVRSLIESRKIPRGQISAQGQVLAESHPDENGNYQRSYPAMPWSFGPVVGYFSSRYGSAGLESGYNGTLSGQGKNGDASRAVNIFEQKNRRGENIELTIDPQLQALAYDLMSQNNYDGAIVALRPSDGAVLAMSSTPSFDPNQLANPATADDAWAELNADPSAPLLNKATQETLPPGSIFKIITTAAGLKNGYNPASTLTGAADITLPGTNTKLSNYGNQLCGGSQQVTLETAFSLSCNTAFVQMGIDLGDKAIRKAAEDFGVGATYDLGLPSSPGTLGDLPDKAALGQSSIGQYDVTMNALQAAVMAATVANDGRRMEPYVVARTTKADLTEVSKTKPHQLNKPLSPDEATTLRSLMFASERKTTGYDGNGFASKTGTAEHGADRPPHTWYVAFDPNKDVAVGVVVKNGGGQGTTATGGKVAAPIGRAILRAAPKGGRS